MKILLLTPYESAMASVFASQCMDALTSLGHEVRIFDYRKDVPNDLIKYNVSIINNLNFMRNRAVRKRNILLKNEVRKYGPDIFFALKGELISPAVVKEAAGRGIITVNWFPDDPQGLKVSRKISKYYDFYFTYDTYSIPIHKKWGANAYYLPFGAGVLDDKDVCTYAKEQNKKHIADVCFVGSYYPVREKILSKLLDFDLKIWGPGWERAFSLLREKWTGKAICGEEMFKIFRSSKIVLNIHYGYGKSIKKYGYGANHRTFEIAEAGGFQIVDRKKEIPRLFKEDEEIVCFDSIKDLRKKIEYYLNYPDKRAESIRKSRIRVLKEHKIVDRMKVIFELINADKQTGLMNG